MDQRLEVSSLKAQHRLLSTDQLCDTEKQAIGTSLQWPGGQYCAIHTPAGMIGCGLYDCGVATKFGMVLAIARGTPENPLREPEDLLQAKIVAVSEPAQAIGIEPGMTGAEVLERLLA
jgi:uncharacterized protein YunC (DUF1805 family)